MKSLILSFFVFVVSCILIYTTNVEAKEFVPPFQTIPKVNISDQDEDPVFNLMSFNNTDKDMSNYKFLTSLTDDLPWRFTCGGSIVSSVNPVDTSITCSKLLRVESPILDYLSLYPNYYYIFYFRLTSGSASSSSFLDDNFKIYSNRVIDGDWLYNGPDELVEAYVFDDQYTSATYSHRYHFYITFKVNEQVNDFSVFFDNLSISSGSAGYMYIGALSLYQSKYTIEEMQQKEIIENQNKNTQDIIDNQNKNQQQTNDKLDQTNKELGDLNDNLTDNDSKGATDSASNFFTGFKSNEHGLTSVITSPLTLIKSITSQKCSPLALDVPFLQKNNKINLPCMSEIYEEHFGVFLQIYQTVTFGIVAYWVCVKCYAMVKGFQSPDDDKIEVLDL